MPLKNERLCSFTFIVYHIFGILSIIFPKKRKNFSPTQDRKTVADALFSCYPFIIVKNKNESRQKIFLEFCNFGIDKLHFWVYNIRMQRQRRL